MIVAPQGQFGGNRKRPIVQFSQTDFIVMGSRSLLATGTNTWRRILGEKWHKATLQSIKIAAYSNSTFTLGIINIKCYSTRRDGSGNILTETDLVTSGVKHQNLADGKLYEKWAIQIAATTDSQANKTDSIYWKDFTDAEKAYYFEVYDYLYIDIYGTLSGGSIVDLNPQLEVMPFLAD